MTSSMRNSCWRISSVRRDYINSWMSVCTFVSLFRAAKVQQSKLSSRWDLTKSRIRPDKILLWLLKCKVNKTELGSIWLYRPYKTLKSVREVCNPVTHFETWKLLIYFVTCSNLAALVRLTSAKPRMHLLRYNVNQSIHESQVEIYVGILLTLVLHFRTVVHPNFEADKVGNIHNS